MWLNALKIKGFMLICFSMSVPRLARVGTSAARSTRPASKCAIWATTATPPPLSAPIYAPSRSTPTARTLPALASNLARDGWDQEESSAMLTTTADYAEIYARIPYQWRPTKIQLIRPAYRSVVGAGTLRTQPMSAHNHVPAAALLTISAVIVC